MPQPPGINTVRYQPPNWAIDPVRSGLIQYEEKADQPDFGYYSYTFNAKGQYVDGSRFQISDSVASKSQEFSRWVQISTDLDGDNASDTLDYDSNRGFWTIDLSRSGRGVDQVRSGNQVVTLQNPPVGPGNSIPLAFRGAGGPMQFELPHAVFANAEKAGKPKRINTNNQQHTYLFEDGTEVSFNPFNAVPIQATITHQAGPDGKQKTIQFYDNGRYLTIDEDGDGVVDRIDASQGQNGYRSLIPEPLQNRT